MKKYLSWLLFTIAVVNLGSMAIRHGTGRAYLPDLISALADPTAVNIAGAVMHFINYGLIALLFYLWWKWK